jgi:3-deoxy-manno-octulosonate cytidylyltransferase (CMP-KDO synthetase)
VIPKCYGIIPARYDSSRFPGKPLAPIHGRPMFWHVYTRALQCPEMCGVYLATDDERIMDAARSLNVPAVMTRADHASGTDRVLEAVRALELPDDAVIVNIQGDEPALAPEMLSELVRPFADPHVQVSTLARSISPEEAASPDQVKVARAATGLALYFSRAPIPFPRDGRPGYLGHIGLYGFRRPALENFATLGESPLEKMEKLEQLRLLEAGIPLFVAITRYQCCGVDRPEDLETVCRLLEGE